MKNILLLTLFALLFTNCDRDNTAPKTEEEKLPAATQEGENTFGCLIDGTAWKPKAGVLPPPISITYNEITGEFGLIARKNLNNTLSQRVSIYTPHITAGTFLLPFDKSFWSDTSIVCPALTSINPLTGMGAKRYWNTNGTLVISKVDWSSGIIAGTFEFDAYSPECADTVRITQGRFDVKYKY